MVPKFFSFLVLVIVSARTYLAAFLGVDLGEKPGIKLKATGGDY